jgi:DNA-binding beta-propeller fold protein YncE
VTELPGSRDGIGAAAGIALLVDGTLLVVDHLDPDVRTSGGDVKRIAPDGTVSVFATIPDEQGFVLPYDIAVDGAGRVYVSDRGRDEIWRFDPDGGGAAAWWQSPTADGTVQPEPTGLAYDAANAAIIAADASLNRLYRIAISDGSTAVLYQHDSRFEPPGFDGLTVTPDGTIYVAALSLNRVARLDGDSLTYLAQGFRGISDVAYAAPNRLIAANADRFSLAIPAVGPQLPFALDVLTIGEQG